MAESATYRFTASVWKSPGESGWHFLTVPFDIADEIDEISASSRNGFGSVRVEATIGTTTWQTSLFPDSTRRSFLLPVKQGVRASQGVDTGDQVAVSLRLVEPPPE